jgi:hypothetical protein
MRHFPPSTASNPPLLTVCAAVPKLYLNLIKRCSPGTKSDLSTNKLIPQNKWREGRQPRILKGLQPKNGDRTLGERLLTSPLQRAMNGGGQPNKIQLEKPGILKSLPYHTFTEQYARREALRLAHYVPAGLQIEFIVATINSENRIRSCQAPSDLALPGAGYGAGGGDFLRRDTDYRG